MVSDTGGIDDHAFNENAWKGMLDAQAKLGIEVKFLESASDADYEENINQFLSEGCEMIVTVGFLLGDATKVAAEANPDVRFAIVDYAYDPAIPNTEGLVYSTNEAAMLAGYASAAWSDRRHRHVRRDQHQRPRDRLHGRFLAGANYNEEGHGRHGLGWDPVAKTGSFTGNFDSIDDGKTLSLGFLSENADVILGVGGPIGQGIFAAIQEQSAEAVGLGVDVDWYISVPQYKDLILTSILKKIDVSVTAAIERAFAEEPAAPVFVSTLANGGVGLGEFHDYDGDISADTKAELETLEADIIAGTVKPADYFAAN
jgi:basic membrane protein A